MMPHVLAEGEPGTKLSQGIICYNFPVSEYCDTCADTVYSAQLLFVWGDLQSVLIILFQSLRDIMVTSVHDFLEI